METNAAFSQRLSFIRSFNPAHRVASRLRQCGITGWRRQATVEGVTPEFVWIPEKLAVFLHGCFWHGCVCHHPSPRKNSRRILEQVLRDGRDAAKLRAAGWSVFTWWEYKTGRLKLDVLVTGVSLALAMERRP